MHSWAGWDTQNQSSKWEHERIEHATKWVVSEAHCSPQSVISIAAEKAEKRKKKQKTYSICLIAELQTSFQTTRCSDLTCFFTLQVVKAIYFSTCSAIHQSSLFWRELHTHSTVQESDTMSSFPITGTHKIIFATADRKETLSVPAEQYTSICVLHDLEATRLGIGKCGYFVIVQRLGKFWFRW